MLESDIRVENFDDRVEIISPGGLPIGITEEEYLDGRVSISRRIREYYKNSGVNPECLIITVRKFL